MLREQWNCFEPNKLTQPLCHVLLLLSLLLLSLLIILLLLVVVLLLLFEMLPR